MTGPRGHREGELDPQAAAILQALRAADDMPPAAQARVWARLAAATAEPESWPKDKVHRGMSEWAWAAAVVAAAAALLLASRAGVLGPLAGARGGEAASYSEGPGAGPASAATGSERAGGQDAGRGAEAPIEHVSIDMDSGTDEVGSAGPAEARGEARAEVEPVRAGASRPARGEEARSRARGGSDRGEVPDAGAASTLAREAEALARAQAAMQGERAEEALAVLADYAREFPGGALREEHDALRALALCAAGRTVQGRGEARAFLSARGGSALAERVRRGCLDE